MTPSPVRSSAEEIDAIIRSGRIVSRPKVPLRPVLSLSGLSLLLLWLSFTPLELAPLAWVALTPLSLIVRRPVLTGRQLLAVLVIGWIWGVATVQWIRLGHPVMYAALAALGFYLGLYIPAFLVISRRTVRAGCPVWLAVPLVWTALEFLRAWLLTGFSWYYLGHSQYRWIELIQIADITGVYGISFLTAMSAAVVADAFPTAAAEGVDEDADSSGQRWRRPAAGAVVCVSLILAAHIYGTFRQQSPAQNDGPVIALIQGNFSPDEKHDPRRSRRIVYIHDMLTRRAARLQPDLIVWPETMWPMADWIEDPELSEEQIESLVTAAHYAPPDQTPAVLKFFRQGHQTREHLITRSQEAGVPMLVGVVTRTATEHGIREFNSAVLTDPDRRYVGRYDKMHLVVFGEYTPLKTVFPFLASLRPPGMPELTAGRRPRIFSAQGVRYGPAICFEDTVPRVIRRIVRSSDSGGPPDVLVNLTNDAWFRGSCGLDQHLITSLFRCIETRRPMVRAVNGGISAFIDSSGRIRDPDHFLLMTSSDGFDGEFRECEGMIDPRTGRWYRNCSAVLTGQIALDGRNTVYLQVGDLFALLCCLAVAVLIGRSLVRRKTPQQKFSDVSDE